MMRKTTGSRAPTNRAPAQVEAALLGLGLEVLRAGDTEIVCTCPKHFERTGKLDSNPSFSVNRNSGLFGCWSCGYAGTFLKLVTDLKFPNNTFAAARWIRRFGVDLQAHLEGLRIGWEAPEEDAPKLEIGDRFLLYVDPPAAELRARHISAEAAAHYGIRWDTKREAWILPIRDSDGALLGWQIKSARWFRNFPQGVKKGQCLFGLSAFPEKEAAVLLESPLDVARLYTAGYEGGLATYGSQWTEKQLGLVRDVTDTVIAAFDNDSAGWQANNLLIYGEPPKRRPPHDLKTWFLNYKGIKAKDIGDMDDQQIAWAIEHAVPWAHMVTAHLR